MTNILYMRLARKSYIKIKVLGSRLAPSSSPQRSPRSNPLRARFFTILDYHVLTFQ